MSKRKQHCCHCGKWGSFGYGSARALRWYCAEHRPWHEPRVVEVNPAAIMRDEERERGAQAIGKT